MSVEVLQAAGRWRRQQVRAASPREAAARVGRSLEGTGTRVVRVEGCAFAVTPWEGGVFVRGLRGASVWPPCSEVGYK